MNSRINFTPTAPLNTAVLFIVFNRPDLTRQVFDAIRQARPPRLYVAADGPRQTRNGEAALVAKVREIATQVDWPCHVKTLFRDRNAGCQFGPRSGIDWFFQNEEQGIILEDDCLPSQSFFWFCEEMLLRLQNNKRIMAITGTNITYGISFDGDFFQSNYALMWGWASWRRAWNLYDSSLQDWPRLKYRKWLYGLTIGGLPFVLAWSKTFNQTKEMGDKATWWDYQWIYSCWANGGLTIAPSRNLIRNIGYTNEATHTSESHPILSNLVRQEFQWPLQGSVDCIPNKMADEFISLHWFGISWIRLVKETILRIPGITTINNCRRFIYEQLQLRSVMRFKD